jgi:hypothetical protein
MINLVNLTVIEIHEPLDSETEVNVDAVELVLLLLIGRRLAELIPW